MSLSKTTILAARCYVYVSFPLVRPIDTDHALRLWRQTHAMSGDYKERWKDAVLNSTGPGDMYCRAMSRVGTDDYEAFARFWDNERLDIKKRWTVAYVACIRFRDERKGTM